MFWTVDLGQASLHDHIKYIQISPPKVKQMNRLAISLALFIQLVEDVSQIKIDPDRIGEMIGSITMT